MTVDPVTLAAILPVVALVAMAVTLWIRGRRTARLKGRFGPGYARIVQLVGDERKAGRLMHQRERRVDGDPPKPLPPELRQHFITSWMRIQAQFVDDPRRAVTRADDLLGEVMAARRYPLKNGGHQAEDPSIDHAEMVETYRTAHDIALRHARGEASIEEMRMAMVRYRTLFDDLVHEPELHRERPITIEPAGSRR